jgi:hypothetical protein
MSGARVRAALPEVTISESAGVRYLHLSTPWIQGAMRIDDPLAIELEYVRRMVVWMLLREPAGGACPCRPARPRRRRDHAFLQQADEDATAVELNPRASASVASGSGCRRIRPSSAS